MTRMGGGEVQKREGEKDFAQARSENNPAGKKRARTLALRNVKEKGREGKGNRGGRGGGGGPRKG